jgi:hypothetical protein
MEDPDGRLAVVALVVGIVAGAGLVWVSEPPGVNCNAPPSGGTPLGTSFSLNTPTEQSVGSDHWYNFTVGASAAGMVYRSFSFEVQTGSGAPVAPEPGWSLLAVNSSGREIGAYALTGPTAGTWISGGSEPVLSGQAISLLSSPESLSGDTFLLAIAASYANGCPVGGGSVTVSIP